MRCTQLFGMSFVYAVELLFNTKSKIMKFPLMSRFFILVMITYCSFQVHAQSLSMGFEAGTGASYLGEHYGANSSMNFKPSLLMGMHLKYTPTDAYFGIRLHVMNVSTRFYGDGTSYDEGYTGEIATLTTSLMLEHINTEKKWRLGYNFGMGITRENYDGITWPGSYSYDRNFMSISGGGIVAFQMGNKSSLRLSPSFLWTDPINTLRKEEWVQGREDISMLIQLGYTYKLN